MTIKSEDIPHDFFTHFNAWRHAILNNIDRCNEINDIDNKSYWVHELATYDKAMYDLRQLVKEHGQKS